MCRGFVYANIQKNEMPTLESGISLQKVCSATTLPLEQLAYDAP